MTAVEPTGVALSDKYTAADGRVFSTGVQALVRVVLDRMRVDRARGLRTAALVSGYQGSPLGTLDTELSRVRDLLAELDVVHRPGLNEELALTAVSGSQQTGRLVTARYDGVVGVWYGKGPGIDRAGDALRHANLIGAGPRGGMLLYVGDDPAAKSSTVPSASESLLASMHVPVLYPGSLAEILTLGHHAVEMSRSTGLAVALKIVTSVADGAGTVELPTLSAAVAPSSRGVPSGLLSPARILELEKDLHEVRLPAAEAYARTRGLSVLSGATSDGWLGIVASGRTFHDVRHALQLLGLDDDALQRRGIRLLQIGMLYPLDREAVRALGATVDTVLVVEDKIDFLENAVRAALYGSAAPPAVLGRRDLDGSALLPPGGELTPDLVAAAIGRVVARRAEVPSVSAYLHSGNARRPLPAPLPIVRAPFFCSGCPHNRSTVSPAGSLTGAGIGCHGMASLPAMERSESILGVTMMGGEGSQWIGLSPFVEQDHVFQNLGDGTFHHSGSLAVRWAVQAGVNITYKLLWNGSVAMTGGQDVIGQMSVPAVTHNLMAEGVQRIIVTTDEPERYRGVTLAAIAEVRHRDELDAAQRELAAVPGVTVLLHDQECAADKRRRRKRQQLATPAHRVVINERVCEGCGDCGQKSNCLSVHPVETAFGPKTQIHQSSCNLDASCLAGDCPSFVTVVPGGARATAGRLPELPDLAPAERAPAPTQVRIVGVGGTGVVTLSQVLGVAALSEGLHTWGLDMTGLSQKGGAVVSDMWISDTPVRRSNRATRGAVDVLLACDAVSASTPQQLELLSARTAAVVNGEPAPTADEVVGRQPGGSRTDLVARIASAGDSGRTWELPFSSLAEALFGDAVLSNMLLLGAAYQRGLLPVGEEALRSAITLNGVQVERNLLALSWGRALVVEPALVSEVLTPTAPEPAPQVPADLLPLVVDAVGAWPDLEQVLHRCVENLVGFGGRSVARRYLSDVGEIARRERAVGGDGRLTRSVAVRLHDLTAYKDEYEVARLHLLAGEQAKLRAEFGADAKVTWHLHPPLLRALGLRRKLTLGPWFASVLRVLAWLRFLRSTRLDVFGYAEVRRVERRIRDDYRSLVLELTASSDADAFELAREASELAATVKGYEGVKLAAVQRYEEDLAALLARRAGSDA